MKITLVMVASVDGKTTKAEESSIYQWTSKEDRQYFFTLLEKQSVVIMGRNTYESARSIMKISPKTLRVVLTSKPEKFKKYAVKGQLEFSSESPKKLLQRLTDMGYTEALLIGGATTNGNFLKENLITGAWITLEPKLLGKGNSLITTGQACDVNLKLQTVERLNSQGTLLLKYKITEIITPLQ